MKLYRYEIYNPNSNKYEGMIKSIKRHEAMKIMISHDVKYGINNSRNKTLHHTLLYEYEFIRELNSPTKCKFKNKQSPPYDALFYYTKVGLERFGKYMRLLESYYKECGYQVRLICIEVNNNYEVYYKDKYQVCIRLIED